MESKLGEIFHTLPISPSIFFIILGSEKIDWLMWRKMSLWETFISGPYMTIKNGLRLGRVSFLCCSPFLHTHVQANPLISSAIKTSQTSRSHSTIFPTREVMKVTHFKYLSGEFNSNHRCYQIPKAKRPFGRSIRQRNIGANQSLKQERLKC